MQRMKFKSPEFYTNMAMMDNYLNLTRTVMSFFLYFSGKFLISQAGVSEWTKKWKNKTIQQRLRQNTQQQQEKMDNFISLTNNQWIASHRNQECVLINAYTKEEYSSHIIPRSHPVIKEYKKRQVLLLPHTPKIVLLECETQMYANQLLLLVQNGQYQLAQLIQDYATNSKNFLDILYDVVKTAQVLYKKYGPFMFTQNMIKVSKGPSILLWIHQSYYMNCPQFHLLGDNVKDMIMSLLGVLENKMPMIRLIKQLRKGEKQFQGFECVIKYILNQQLRRRKLSLTPTKQVLPSITSSRVVVKPPPNKCPSTLLGKSQQSRTHKQSFDSKSTKSDNESLVKQLQNKGRLQTLDTRLELVERRVLESIIMPEQFYYYWDDSLASEFARILKD